jgi:hypothetical protein
VGEGRKTNKQTDKQTNKLTAIKGEYEYSVAEKKGKKEVERRGKERKKERRKEEEEEFSFEAVLLLAAVCPFNCCGSRPLALLMEGQDIMVAMGWGCTFTACCCDSNLLGAVTMSIMIF